MKIKDHRKSFRIKCKEPIYTQISIVKVNNKTVTTGTGNISVEDIGLGGLKFLSGLNMPVSDVMIIEFKLVIAEELTAFYGYIVRKEELADGVFRYGIKFINDSIENEKSIRKLYKLKTQANVDMNSFYYGDVSQSVKTYQGKKNLKLYRKYKLNNKGAVKISVHTSSDKDIQYEWKDVLINNISQNRIEFISDYRLPRICNEMLEFKINISDREICEKVYVFREEELEEGIYSYKAKFKMSESEKKNLGEILKNTLGIPTKNSMKKWRSFTGEYKQHQYNDKTFEWWA